VKNKGREESLVSSDASFKKQIKQNLYRQKKPLWQSDLEPALNRDKTSKRTCGQLRGAMRNPTSLCTGACETSCFLRGSRPASCRALSTPSCRSRNQPRFPRERAAAAWGVRRSSVRDPRGEGLSGTGSRAGAGRIGRGRALLLARLLPELREGCEAMAQGLPNA